MPAGCVALDGFNPGADPSNAQTALPASRYSISDRASRLNHALLQLSECACLTGLKRSIMVTPDRLAVPPRAQSRSTTSELAPSRRVHPGPVTVDKETCP